MDVSICISAFLLIAVICRYMFVVVLKFPVYSYQIHIHVCVLMRNVCVCMYCTCNSDRLDVCD